MATCPPGSVPTCQASVQTIVRSHGVTDGRRRATLLLLLLAGALLFLAGQARVGVLTGLSTGVGADHRAAGPGRLRDRFMPSGALLPQLPPVRPASQPDAAARVRLEARFGRMPLSFIENCGQLDPHVAYYVQGRDKSLYFTSRGITFGLAGPRGERRRQRRRNEQPAARTGWAVRLDFVGARPDARPRGQMRTSTVVSYFRGPREEWQTGLRSFSSIIYKDLWPGIDLVCRGTMDRLKYEFVVRPGADPQRVRLAYRGATGVRLNPAGQLEVATPMGGFQDDRPYAYQKVNGRRVAVSVSYALLPGRSEDRGPRTVGRKPRRNDGADPRARRSSPRTAHAHAHSPTQYHFELGTYDSTKPLVIDPTVLIYCGYIGGSGIDVGSGIAVDSAGNAYITGYASSIESSFPHTIGPYLTHNGGTYDAFVARVRADGTGLDYCGYIGGSGADYGNGVAVDSAGNAYVVGYTASTEATFPETVGPDLTHNGGSFDAFVAKVNSAGTGLDYCGYIGGSNADYGNGIAVDSFGQAYITGSTYSTEATFPVTRGPDLTQNGDEDAFVARVKADGTDLDYCGYIGGASADVGRGITVDGVRNAYVVGDTYSTQATFPVTQGPDPTQNGARDAFVARVNAAGARVTYCGYIGGSDADYGYSIAVDSSRNAYVAGTTASTEATFPKTVGPYLTYSGGSFDAFVAKVSTAGTGLDYCGYLGGSDADYGNGIAVDSTGNAYVVGYTASTEATFPKTVGPYLTHNGGLYDAFLAKVNDAGTGLDYCGYLGGSGADYSYAVAVDSSGNAYVAGASASTEATFPVIAGPYLSHNGGSDDAFLAKVRDTGPTAVRLVSFTATGYGNGTLLQWRTGYEVDNLGFHVYREGGGQRVRLNPSLIAGSALLAGSGTALTAGQSYSWWDPEPVAAGYWLEDVDLNGMHTWHGPLAPVSGGPVAPEPARAALLAALQQKAGAGVFSGPARRTAPPIGSPRGARTQQALAARPAAKILIREEGWYRVGQPELVAAGLDPSTNPRTLRLYAEGEEVPILVRGEADGRFDPEDAIEFYGLGLDTPSTDTRVYWLVASARRHRRIPWVRERGWPGRASIFPFTVARRERSVYFASLLNGEAENFFGPVVTAEGVDQALDVRHLGPGGPALLEVALQGVTELAGTPDHRVRLFLNGAEVGTAAFEGRDHHVVSLPIPPLLLREGQNVVTLRAEGGEADVSLVDTIRITYWRTYTADGDMLRFTAAGRQQVTLEGFTSPSVRVMDVTDPNAVLELAGQAVPYGEGYACTVSVPGPSGARRTLFAFADERARSPAGLVANQPSSWARQARGADLVILTCAEFRNSVAPLRQLRESQGLSVAVVDVEDVYDEFSFGQKDPGALRRFLFWVRTRWRPAPRFALLVGDASFDPRNYLGLGSFDFVPTGMVATSYLETASDDWFADFNGDGVPEMAVGRLPVRTARQAGTVVAKIVSYDRTDPAGAWRRQALLVADRNQGFDFEAASAQLRALLPAGITTWEVRRGRIDAATARSQVRAGIEGGQLVVNYLGHGSVDTWAGGLLTSADAATLGNEARLPVFVNMTCLNGHFQDLYRESLGKALLNAEHGGAVAVWASSGLTDPSGQTALNQALYRLLFGRSLTLGEAVAGAKVAVGDRDIRRTWILFGDPSMKVQ
ncbi:MAG: SBBP repeat-containing protein [Armatimonadetes bacterium]|nr:SBBP repeat-containing protein [Armatimonadota bacterium]